MNPSFDIDLFEKEKEIIKMSFLFLNFWPGIKKEKPIPKKLMGGKTHTY